MIAMTATARRAGNSLKHEAHSGEVRRERRPADGSAGLPSAPVVPPWCSLRVGRGVDLAELDQAAGFVGVAWDEPG